MAPNGETTRGADCGRVRTREGTRRVGFSHGEAMRLAGPRRCTNVLVPERQSTLR